ncbi:20537_t:CDS:2 [Gigaspora margarita]|uniref:20537_t:CDS:1 n=1 Tax=Gigaspora margarita TaxID=4874 RepID=A0ABN7V022_GIGMA|nr:20537_t:CDS:2 [Gigaspora margarita]
MLAYAYINLLEMLRRFDPNEVSDPNLCSHYPSCTMCSDPEELLISKSEYAKWIKEFLKTKRPLVKYEYKRHTLFVCRFCFGEWFYKSDSCQKRLNRQEEQEVREIQPGQWHDKDISDSTAPSIYNPITGGSGKTTRAIKIFKNINMVVFTHTNSLAKDFQNDHKVKAQTWHSFFRWNGVGEWTSERMGEKKFLRVVIWDEVCTVPKHILEKFINYLLEQKCQVICCGNDAQPPLFFGEMPHSWLKKQANYYEEVLTNYRAKCSKLCELKKGMHCKNN